MNFTRIGKLNNLVRRQLKRKPTIILNPTPAKPFRITGNPGVCDFAIDTDEWNIPDKLNPFINEVVTEDSTVEDKILKIYQKLCADFVYDDNVLSYIKKNDNDTFFLPDDYGRDTDGTWKENRKKHNRRNCFEISRILAKSIIETLDLLKLKNNYDVCIIWDETVTHYFVGIASEDYYVTLDLDDFNQIKDLTRMKTNLTLNGVGILEDSSDLFQTALNKVNEERVSDSQDAIEMEISNANNKEINDVIELDDLKFLQYTIQILKEKYNLDSAGIFEYIKEIVDSKIGGTARSTVWKKVPTNPGIGTRHTRCLVVTIDDVKHLVDVTEDSPDKILKKYDPNDPSLIPFKNMCKEWSEDPFDGR